MDTNTISEKPAAVVEKIKGRLTDLAENELPKVQKTYDQSRQKAEKEIRHAIDQYGPKVQDASEKAQKTVNSLVTSAEAYARRHPWQAAMIALAVLGMVLNFFRLTRRSQPSYVLNNEFPFD
jgi:ElaB/YqjD/DUF883 family membrane-anchored ribosome-binding protein